MNEPNFLKNYHTLFEIGNLILSEVELEPLLKKCIDKVIEVTGAKRGFIALISDKKLPDFKVARNLDKKDIEQPEFEVSKSIIKHVASTGEAVCLPDAMTDSKFGTKKSVLNLQLLSVLCTPIVFENQIVGLIYVDNPDKRELFDDSVSDLILKFSQQIAIALNNAMAFSLEKQKNQQLVEELRAKYQFEELIGRDPKMIRLLEKVAQVAETNSTVLIQGESGTGKELIARALHKNSPRSQQRFEVVHCGAIPETLLESQLFGHKRGAFTGAIEKRRGQFELANGGTIFLDEIGELTPGTQVKLLRVLQDGTFTPLGEEQEKHCDVRIVTATNRNLREMVKDGKFREDLFYRLNVVPITVPPLRERRADIMILADHFIRKYAKHDKLPPLSKPVQKFLMEYDYPGNVRELENIIEHAAIFCKIGRIEIEHLHEELQFEIIEDDGEIVYRELKQKANEKWERSFFEWLLTRTNGKVRQAAILANMDLATLSKKLGQYGIRFEDYK
jgi:Nif-specific regulatory protein